MGFEMILELLEMGSIRNFDQHGGHNGTRMGETKAYFSNKRETWLGAKLRKGECSYTEDISHPRKVRKYWHLPGIEPGHNLGINGTSRKNR